MKQPIFNDIIQGNISDIKINTHTDKTVRIFDQAFVTWECFGGGKNIRFFFFPWPGHKMMLNHVFI